MEETYRVNIGGETAEITFTDSKIIIRSGCLNFFILRTPGKKECQLGCIVAFLENINNCKKLGLLAPVCVIAEFFALQLCLAKCIL